MNLTLNFFSNQIFDSSHLTETTFVQVLPTTLPLIS